MTSIEKTPVPGPRNKPDARVQATAAEKKNAPETKNVTEQADKPKFTMSVPQLNAEAQALVNTVDRTRSQLRQHPHYYQNEQLQTLGKDLAGLHAEVVAFLRSDSPIPRAFTERVQQQLAQAVAIHGEVECARFLAELEQANKLTVRGDLEKSVQTYKEPIGQPNLITPENATTTKARTDMVSRNYRQYGNTMMLGKIVREVGDKDGWLLTSDYMPDEALREQTLVQDASRAVDLRLTEMGALLRQQPDRVGLDVHAAREAYHGEVRQFAEALVGAGDVRHPALYQPELAARYGQEAMAGYHESITGVELALDWVRALDAKISGRSKSDDQRAAIDGLMSGIRQGLQEKMDAVGRSVAGRPELEQQYHAIALDMARLFRTVSTAANSANLLSADTIRFHDKLQNGGDLDFARSMMECSMDFDALAYEHHVAGGGSDPLYEEIRTYLPAIESTMSAHPSLAEIRQNPEVEQMLTRLRAKPVSLQESSEHYSEFCSLRALMSSLDHPESAQQPDAVSLQREIQQKMQPVTGLFREYLATQSGAIENGTLMIGGTVLDAGKQESMKLLADMEGFGVMDVSDTTAGYVKTGGKIAASIAVGVAVGAATGGLGIIASSIAVGASMTAYNIAAEGRSFDSWEEAAEKVGKEFVLNAAGAGFGRVLAGARYAAQLRNVDTVGMGAKEIFAKSMQRGGMKLFSEHYDECVTLGAKLTAAGAEGVVDTLGSSALDTAFQGGEFWDNVRMNAMFCGISIGTEIGSDARRMVQWAADVRPETLKQLDGKMRANNADIESLHALCKAQKLDPQAVYRADASGLATMLQSMDAQPAEQIRALQARIQKQAAEIDQLLRNDVPPDAAEHRQTTTTDERTPDAPQDAPGPNDLAKAGNVEGLKEYLSTHPEVDAPTRAQLLQTLLGRTEPFTPAEVEALWRAHADERAAMEIGSDLTMGKGRAKVEFTPFLSRAERRLAIESGILGNAPTVAKIWKNGDHLRTDAPRTVRSRGTTTVTIPPGEYTLFTQQGALPVLRGKAPDGRLLTFEVNPMDLSADLTVTGTLDQTTPAKPKPTLALDGNALTEEEIRRGLEAGTINPDAVLVAVQAQTNIEQGRFYGNLISVANLRKQEMARKQPSPAPVPPPQSAPPAAPKPQPTPAPKPQPTLAPTSGTVDIFDQLPEPGKTFYLAEATTLPSGKVIPRGNYRHDYNATTGKHYLADTMDPTKRFALPDTQMTQSPAAPSTAPTSTPPQAINRAPAGPQPSPKQQQTFASTPSTAPKSRPDLDAILAIRGGDTSNSQEISACITAATQARWQQESFTLTKEMNGMIIGDSGIVKVAEGTRCLGYSSPEAAFIAILDGQGQPRQIVFTRRPTLGSAPVNIDQNQPRPADQQSPVPQSKPADAQDTTGKQQDSSAHQPRQQTPDATTTSPNIESTYKRAAEITNMPETSISAPEMQKLIQLVSEAPTVAKIHVIAGDQGRTYTDFGNKRALEILGNGNMRSKDSSLPSSLTGMTRYNYLSPENKSTESITIADTGNGYRKLTYYYHSKNYMDPSGKNPGSALSIDIYLKADDANRCFQYLQDHPDSVRPLFKIASDSLDTPNRTGASGDVAASRVTKPAEYLWSQRKPPYSQDDSQGPQRILFVDRGEKNNFSATCRTRESSDSEWKAEELPSRYQ